MQILGLGRAFKPIIRRFKPLGFDSEIQVYTWNPSNYPLIYSKHPL